MSQLPGESQKMLSNPLHVIDHPGQPSGLVAGFAHDLKVPISTIVASAELLEEELDSSMSSHLLGVIERQRVSAARYLLSTRSRDFPVSAV